MGASALVASGYWWHNRGVSCAFLSTGGAPHPGGDGQEKQGRGLHCGYQHAGAPAFPRGMLQWCWQLQPSFVLERTPEGRAKGWLLKAEWSSNVGR